MTVFPERTSCLLFKKTDGRAVRPPPAPTPSGAPPSLLCRLLSLPSVLSFPVFANPLPSVRKCRRSLRQMRRCDWLFQAADIRSLGNQSEQSSPGEIRTPPAFAGAISRAAAELRNRLHRHKNRLKLFIFPTVWPFSQKKTGDVEPPDRSGAKVVI